MGGTRRSPIGVLTGALGAVLLAVLAAVLTVVQTSRLTAWSRLPIWRCKLLCRRKRIFSALLVSGLRLPLPEELD